MANLDVVGLGMNVLDILIRLDEMPTWQHPGSPSRVLVDGGGWVATALVAAQKFGLRTGFIGTHGNDQNGRIKHQLLAQYGVDLTHDFEIPHPENQLCVVYVRASDGERFFSGPADFSSFFLDPSVLDRAYITQAPLLHLDGYHHQAALQAAEWMRVAGKRVVLDGGTREGPHLGDDQHALAAVTDILIGGSGYLQAFTGEADIEKAGQIALTMGPSVVVQTEGARGSYTFSAEASFHTPAFPIEPVDTTGAGDVFHGAYLYGLVQGWGLTDIARFATAAAALECMSVGGRVGIPTLHEVKEFMKQRP
jgi:ribokinase